MDWLLQNQSKAYWIAIVLAFLAAALVESVRPFRAIAGVEQRWGRHGVLFAAGSVISGFVLRFSPVGLAILFADSPYGLLNRLPFWPACLLTVVVLDLVHYVTHWVLHHVGWLWRVHAVHHSDADYDVSTAVRFHPVEFLVGGSTVLAVIAVLAPPPIAVLISELLTVIMNLFVHANVVYPPVVERVMRTIFVTPSIHRIHHGEDCGDQNTNYGQSLVVWDRLFSTFRANPTSGAGLTGLAELRGCDSQSFRYLLTAPFQRQK